MPGVFEIRSKLVKCFHAIQRSTIFDKRYVTEATGLERLLEDGEFLFFLSFFSRIFCHVDVLYGAMQSRLIDGASVQSCISDFCNAVSGIRKTVQYNDSEGALRRGQTSQCLVLSAKECCDILINQIVDRLCTGHLAAFALMNPKNFSNFARQFPPHLLVTVSKFYPVISVKKLVKELQCIYTNQIFSNIASTYALNRFIRDNTLAATFTATSQLLDIILTTPISSVEAERSFSTLKRIKTCLRNTMKQDRLNSLSCAFNP